MSTTTKFNGKITAHTQHAHFVAILFTKKRHGPFANRVVHAHHFCSNNSIGQYLIINDMFYLPDLLFGHRFVV